VVAVLLASLTAATGLAATAYVSDDLVLGVYAEQNSQGARLATLHSGASVAVLATSGDFTQVQLADGTSGWVRSSFLVTHEPAAARVKELEDELSRTRATTPELAEAAARSEALQLKGQLAAVQSELDSVRAAAGHGNASSPMPRDGAGRFLHGYWPIWLGTASVAVLLGFWLGYSAMARRIQRKFGGIKVY
jgi:SH3-like domain-containing protein